MGKREASRAIIFEDNKIILMYRERQNRVYFTFPGGGKENGETDSECVEREVMEEFGITIKPIREVFCYEDSKSIQHIFLCEWVSGEFGTGHGEEFQENSDGLYIPTMVEIQRLKDIPLMPPEITNALLENLESVKSDDSFFKKVYSEREY